MFTNLCDACRFWRRTQIRDPDGQPMLSLEQCKVSSAWRRSLQVVPQASMSIPLLPDDIIQHIVTDCSVCASLSVCLEHHRRFKSQVGLIFPPYLPCFIYLVIDQLGLSSTYPQDAEGIPRLSAGGRYDLRLLFNGAYRRVIHPSFKSVSEDCSDVLLFSRSVRHLSILSSLPSRKNDFRKLLTTSCHSSLTGHLCACPHGRRTSSGLLS
jgi:hypothetical protein